MRLLLDSHAYLFANMDTEQLPPPVARALADPENERWVSVATGWELTIKAATGRLQFAATNFLPTLLALDAALLPIRASHLAELASLPTHHRDPFDRMLIAQARVEGLTIVTRDRAFSGYGVPVLW